MAIIMLVLFGLIIIGGMYLLSYVLVEKNTPKGIAIMHGSIAGLAIIIYCCLLFYHALFYVLILYLLTATSGIALFAYDISGKKIPKIFALTHGLLAIGSFIALILILFQ